MKKNLILTETYSDNMVEISEAMDADVFSMTITNKFHTLSSPIPEDNPMLGIETKISNPSIVKINGLRPEFSIQEKYDSDPIEMVCDWVSKNSHGSKSRIFICFDLDTNGQFMASIMYHNLLKRGLKEEQLLRVILLEIEEWQGVDHINIGFGEFYDEIQMRNLLEHRRIEMEVMHLSPRTKIGFRKMACVYELEHARSIGRNNFFVENINPTGTSLVTYLTKHSLSEGA